MLQSPAGLCRIQVRLSNAAYQISKQKVFGGMQMNLSLLVKVNMYARYDNVE